MKLKNGIIFDLHRPVEKVPYVFHTFSTKNFLPWFPIYCRSIKQSYGDDSKIILQTLNASSEDFQLLRHLDASVEIHNLELSDEEISDFLLINSRTLSRFRDEMAYGKTTDENFKFKIFISVYLRYLTIKSMLVLTKKKLNFEYFIHSDVDISHRTDVPKKMGSNNFDLALFGRNYAKSDNVPLGAYLIFKNSESSISFLDYWYSFINEMPFHKWPRGFGQMSLGAALEVNLASKQFKIIDLSEDNEITFSKSSERSSDIWLNSNSKHQGSSFEVPYANSLTDIVETTQAFSDLFRR